MAKSESPITNQGYDYHNIYFCCSTFSVGISFRHIKSLSKIIKTWIRYLKLLGVNISPDLTSGGYINILLHIPEKQVKQ